MACKECEERRKKLRDAILRGKMAEAAGHVVAGVREMVRTGERHRKGGYVVGVSGIENDVPEEFRPVKGEIAAKPAPKRRRTK